MDIKPYLDRLIAGVKSAAIQVVLFFIGWLIADAVASHWYPRYGFYWFLTLLLIWLAYWGIIWLLTRAWERSRRSSN